MKYFFPLLFCIFSAFGQQVISGRVIGEDLEIPMGITVFDQDTTELGKSDWDGNFKIELPKKTEGLIFAGLGYEWTRVSIPKNCEYLEIILLTEVIYDFMSSKKIDHLRKKRFNNLPNLHDKALKKGLFENRNICYNRDFEAYKPDLDRISRELKEFRKTNKIDFNDIKIGDIVKIPFGVDSVEKRIRTYYSPCENCTEEDYDYVIEGEIINKFRKRLTLEIKVTEMQEYDSLTYRGNVLNVGSDFKYEMKFYEVIINTRADKGRSLNKVQ